MRLSRAAAYAVHALAHLAAGGEGCRATAAALAPGAGTTPAFLAKILEPLAAAGLLASSRGPGGGYRLARPLSRITLLEVIEAVDGPLGGRCAAPESAHPAFDRRLEAACERAAGSVRKQLAKVRLSDLAGGR